ncbi:MAG: hypothetical protein R2806_23650 [Saprospiraceae bacterium]
MWPACRSILPEPAGLSRVDRNGMLNGAITSTQTNGNHGAITVFDAQGQSQPDSLSMTTAKVLYSPMKNFRTPIRSETSYMQV